MGAAALAGAVGYGYSGTASPVPPVLRLHVIAQSDRGVDQAAKLAVRDAVLGVLDAELRPAASVAQAEALARRAAPQLRAAADRVLAALGRPYRARVLVGTFAFPARTYQGLELPAGRYPAVEVVLGRGSGQNWWCVVFPPLCLVDPVAASWTLEPVALSPGPLPAPSVPVRMRSAFLILWQDLVGRRPGLVSAAPVRHSVCRKGDDRRGQDIRPARQGCDQRQRREAAGAHQRPRGRP